MKARLARPLYFLRVLNEEDPAETRWGEGDAVERLRQLLFRLAAHLRDGTPVNNADQRLISELISGNAQFEFMADFHDPAAGPIRSGGGEGGLLKHTELHAWVTPKSGQSSRLGVYLEAVLSLLEACEEGGVRLRTCLNCGNWFVPYSRTRTPKFCSPKCRTLFHYRANKGATFRCGGCGRDTPIEHFSGLCKTEEDFVAGGVDDEDPMCLACVLAQGPLGWQDYLEAVTYGRLS